jgi:hypothetical protein
MKKEEVKISKTEYAVFLRYQVEQTREVNVSGYISENSVLNTYHRPGRGRGNYRHPPSPKYAIHQTLVIFSIPEDKHQK